MPLAADAYSEPLILLHTSSGFKLCDGLVFNSTILKVFLFNCTSMLSPKYHHYLKMKVLTPFCFIIGPISISNKYFFHVYVKWYFFVSQYIMDFFFLRPWLMSRHSIFQHKKKTTEDNKNVSFIFSAHLMTYDQSYSCLKCKDKVNLWF